MVDYLDKQKQIDEKYLPEEHEVPDIRGPSDEAHYNGSETVETGHKTLSDLTASLEDQR